MTAPARTAAPQQTPTDRWFAAVPVLPPLTGAAGTAERLLLLLHYGVDWDAGWVSGKRHAYWDRILSDYVLQAALRAANLRRFWQQVSPQLQSRPRNSAERVELEALLRADDRAVLEALRWETEALQLRVRIVAEAVRAARQTEIPA
ncbi:MAG TPA: hypothetical protein VFC16_07040 [Nakamurella sp.]|jgi:hypothetical protein|nr:hypothetical protein [Nakamurella sp.]